MAGREKRNLEDAGPGRIIAEIGSRFSRVPRFRFPRAGWRWASALAGLFLAFFATLWFVRYFEHVNGRVGSPTPTGENEQVQIHYVRIGGEPAPTFIFQPYDSNIVIVWAGKNSEER